MSRAGTRLLLAAALAAALAAGCRATIVAEGERVAGEVGDDAEKTAAAFFRRPLLSHLKLSPDGTKFAAIHSRDGIDTLVVRGVFGGEIHWLAKLERSNLSRSWEIRRLGWPSNDHVVVSLGMPDAHRLGVRSRQSRLMLVPLDGGAPEYIGDDWPYQEYSQSQDNVLSWLPDEPDHILLSLWLPGEKGASARKVNVHNGALRMVAKARPGSLWWAADHRGRVRAGGGEASRRFEEFTVARAGDGDFVEIQHVDEESERSFTFAGFGHDDATIYVYAPNEHDRRSVFEYDLRSRRLGREVFGHPEVDVGSLVTSPLDGRLLAVSYATDRPRLEIVDETEGAFLRQLEAALPGWTTRVTSWSQDGRRALVVSSSDVHPPQYFLFERDERKLSLLVESLPELDGVALAPMEAVHYEARDGLRIDGYLTRPPGAEPPFPTIVLPHGGPWARDVQGWEPEVQFLASRGYAVLQPNFRGSSGYGKAFFEHGRGRWGLEMQDDITDGARWLVEQGIADADRIGIYGASYGGFAALQAMMKEPELFRAGASLNGVTDVLTLLSDDRRYWGFADDMERLVGDRRDDHDRLAAISPARNGHAFRGPVLIAHGTHDWRVHVRQAEAMADALEEAEVPHQLLLYEGESHHFIDERNKIDFYTNLAAFFAKHLTPTGE